MRIRTLAVALVLVVATVCACAQTDNTKLIVSGNFVSVNNATDNNGFKATQELMLAGNSFGPTIAARSDQFILPGSVIALIEGEYRYALARVFKKDSTYAFNGKNTTLLVYGGVGNGRSTLGTNTKSSFAWAIGGGMDLSVNGTLSFRPIDIAYVHSPFLTNNGQVLGHWELASGFGLKLPW